MIFYNVLETSPAYYLILFFVTKINFPNISAEIDGGCQKDESRLVFRSTD
jgi:hypothetical protein